MSVTTGGVQPLLHLYKMHSNYWGESLGLKVHPIQGEYGNSWFNGSKLSLETILKLIYYWTWDLSNDYVQIQLGIGSNKTLVDWFNFCRQVCIGFFKSGKHEHRRKRHGCRIY